MRAKRSPEARHDYLMYRTDLAMERLFNAHAKAERERCVRWSSLWMTAVGIRKFPTKPAAPTP